MTDPKAESGLINKTNHRRSHHMLRRRLQNKGILAVIALLEVSAVVIRRNHLLA